MAEPGKSLWETVMSNMRRIKTRDGVSVLDLPHERQGMRVVFNDQGEYSPVIRIGENDAVGGSFTKGPMPIQDCWARPRGTNG